MVKLAIKAKNVSVTYAGNHHALKRVTTGLSQGKIIGVIGPSGAGKTTFLRAVVGRQKLTSGSIEVLGHSAGHKDLRHNLTYMTQSISVYEDLNIEQNLFYFSKMINMRKKIAKKQIKILLKLLGLSKYSKKLVANLSGGQKQRVSLAVSLLGDPQILVLDEPTTGLDPVIKADLWELFKKLKKEGRTLIISSHSMDEAEKCDELVLIRDGRLLAHNSPKGLKHKTHTKSIEKAFLKLVRGKKK